MSPAFWAAARHATQPKGVHAIQARRCKMFAFDRAAALIDVIFTFWQWRDGGVPRAAEVHLRPAHECQPHQDRDSGGARACQNSVNTKITQHAPPPFHLTVEVLRPERPQHHACRVVPHTESQTSRSSSSSSLPCLVMQASVCLMLQTRACFLTHRWVRRASQRATCWRRLRRCCGASRSSPSISATWRSDKRVHVVFQSLPQ